MGIQIEAWDRAAVLRRLESQLGGAAAAKVRPAFEQLLDARTPQTFHAAERAIHDVLREVADEVVALGLQAVAVEPAFEEAQRAHIHAIASAVGVRLKGHGRRATPVRLLGGTEVEIEALKMQRVNAQTKGGAGRKRTRGKLGQGVYPTLAALGITGFSTPALREAAAAAMASANSVDAARASLRAFGVDLPHKMFLRLAYSFADHSLQARKETQDSVPLPQTGELAGKRVVICLDGGRTRIRKSPRHGRRRPNGHRRFDAPWREPRLITIYVVGEDGKRDREHDMVIDGTFGTCDDVVALLVGHLRLRGAHQAAHLHMTADGAHWIWNRAEDIRRGVGIAEDRFHQLVDFWHVVQKFGVVADTQEWEKKERRAFFARNKGRLRRAAIGQVLDELLELRTRSEGEARKAIDGVLTYFDNHDARMAYDVAKSLGLPLGSGSVESAVRRVVNQRLKGNSIYWVEEHAEGVLHLRSFMKAGRWDELVRTNLERPVWRPPLQEVAA